MTTLIIHIFFLNGYEPSRDLLDRDMASFNYRLREANLPMMVKYVKQRNGVYLPIHTSNDGRPALKSDDVFSALSRINVPDGQYKVFYLPNANRWWHPPGQKPFAGMSWLGTNMAFVMSGPERNRPGFDEWYTMQHEIGHLLGIHHDTPEWPGGGHFDFYAPISKRTINYLNRSEELETPTPPEEPEPPNDDLAGKVAALETRMAALEASMAAQRTALEASITALAAAVATQQTTLEASMAEQRTALEASITELEALVDRLREDLEQRMAEVETAVDDASPSRLMMLPVNQLGDQQEEPQ